MGANERLGEFMSTRPKRSIAERGAPASMRKFPRRKTRLGAFLAWQRRRGYGGLQSRAKRRGRGRQAHSKTAKRQQSTSARDARGLRPLTPARPAPPSHAQGPAVLDHARPLPQGYRGAGPTLPGGGVGGAAH